MLIKFLAVPNTNVLIVNIELTKIKITVVINLKWHNLDYPCYLVGRTHVTIPVTTKPIIPRVELVLPTTRIGRLYGKVLNELRNYSLRKTGSV